MFIERIKTFNFVRSLLMQIHQHVENLEIFILVIDNYRSCWKFGVLTLFLFCNVLATRPAHHWFYRTEEILKQQPCIYKRPKIIIKIRPTLFASKAFLKALNATNITLLHCETSENYKNFALSRWLNLKGYLKVKPPTT